MKGGQALLGGAPANNAEILQSKSLMAMRLECYVQIPFHVPKLSYHACRHAAHDTIHLASQVP